MFITIQIPLVDYRSLQDNPAKLKFPEWPDPDSEEDNMLYFGKIFNKDDKYKGPWDGEKRYCDVSSVVNFCGMEDIHFHKSLQLEWSAKILFRRFQSDGRFLAKFEFGFFDNFESTLNPGVLTDGELKKLLYQHINQYLLCPVKVKKGSRKFDKKNRYTDFIPLVHTGNALASSYYWSTYKGDSKRSFNEKTRRDYIAKCDPLVLVQIDSSHLEVKQLAGKEIDMPGLQSPDAKLFFDYIPHNYQQNEYYTKTWTVAVKETSASLPLQDDDFRQYDKTIKNLRINLIRLHAEVEIAKKILERIGKQNPGDLGTPAVKSRAIYNLHKILYNLSKDERNSQPQQDLVQAAFRLEEQANPEESMEDRVKGLQIVISELKQLENTEANQRITNYVTQTAEKIYNIHKVDTANFQNDNTGAI
ncbi:MAG: hypothetical protein ABI472_24905 [Ginsengibacter sp.]